MSQQWSLRDWLDAALYGAPLHFAMLLMQDVTRYTALGAKLTRRLQNANDEFIERYK